MTSTNDNPSYTFWLARYAYNQLAPLFAQAKAIEPSLEFGIELTFADEDSKFSHDHHINISAHWNREGMFQHSSWLRDRADVDLFITKVTDDVANLKPLEAGLPA